MLRLGAVGPEYVDEAEGKDFLEGILHFLAETDVSEEVFGAVDVDSFGRDVKVAEPDEFFGWLKVVLEISAQSLEPVEFVAEFFRVRLETLGDVCVYYRNAVYDGFCQSRLVFWLVIEAEGDVADRAIAENCDAVIFFLPAEDDVIAGVVECFEREIVVLDLCLLYAEHIGLIFGEPIGYDLDPGPQGIGIEGCDLHFVLSVAILAIADSRMPRASGWRRRDQCLVIGFFDRISVRPLFRGHILNRSYAQARAD